MTSVLIATDSPAISAQVRSVLHGDHDVTVVNKGADVLPAVNANVPAIAIVDFQIGNMGGMAACLDLRLEESGGRLAHIPVLLLLDRRADVFLARRAGAQGWLVKPLEPIRTRKAIAALLAGEEYRDAAFMPVPVNVASAKP